MRKLIASFFLFAILLSSQSVMSGPFQRHTRVSNLNNHVAMQGRGSVLIWDCSITSYYDTPTFSTRTVWYRSSNVSDFWFTMSNVTNPPSFTEEGCVNRVHGDAETTYKFQDIPALNLTKTWSLFAVGQKYSGVQNGAWLFMREGNQYGIMQDFNEANKTRLFTSSFTGTNITDRTVYFLVDDDWGLYGSYTLSYQGDGGYRIAKDGLTPTLFRGTTTALTGTTGRIIVMGDVGDFVFGGRLPLFGIWNVGLDDRDMASHERVKSRMLRGVSSYHFAYDHFVVFMGDSITWGTATELSIGANVRPGTYPYLAAQTLMVTDPNIEWINIGEPSVQASAIAGRVTEYTPLCTTWGTGKTIVPLFVGTNDIAFGGATDVQLETSYSSIASALRAAGCKVAGITMLPRGFTGAQETYRQGYNTWLKANVGPIVDVVIDPTVNAAFSGTSLANPACTPDGTHLTVTCNTTLASYVAPALVSVW